MCVSELKGSFDKAMSKRVHLTNGVKYKGLSSRSTLMQVLSPIACDITRWTSGNAIWFDRLERSRNTMRSVTVSKRIME